jgi:hypothetical protein
LSCNLRNNIDLEAFLGTAQYLLYREVLGRNWGGGGNFFLNPKGREFEKIQKDERRGALKRFTSLKKNWIYSFKNVSENNLTINK